MAKEKINEARFYCDICRTVHVAGEHRVDLRACPFCGYPPIYRLWHGAPRMIECDYDGCHANPSVAGNTWAEVKQRWQHREKRAS